MVIACQVQQNLKLPDAHDDPFKAYRKDEKKGWTPIGLSESRALWRDSHTLFQGTDETNRPPVVNWVARISGLREQGENSIRPMYSIEVTGIATDSGKAANVVFWRHERLPLPLAYLEDKQLADSLREALELTETTAQNLNRAIWTLATGMLASDLDRKPKSEEVRSLADHLAAGRAYWSHLEGPFKRLLVELPDDKGEEGEYGGVQIGKWKSTLRHSLWEAFRESTRGMERSTRYLKPLALAERRLAAMTYKYLSVHEAGGLDDTAA